MSFPLYEKMPACSDLGARKPTCGKPVVTLGDMSGNDPGTIIYEKGHMPADGAPVYRWIYLKDGKYAGATDWYADPDAATEECHVAMRKKAQYRDFSAVVSQTGVFRRG